MLTILPSETQSETEIKIFTMSSNEKINTTLKETEHIEATYY